MKKKLLKAVQISQKIGKVQDSFFIWFSIVLGIYNFALETYEWIETTPMSEERLHAGSVQILEGGKIFQSWYIYEKISSFFVKIFLRSLESVIFFIFHAMKYH